jgi:hypothetical protein
MNWVDGLRIILGIIAVGLVLFARISHISKFADRYPGLPHDSNFYALFGHARPVLRIVGTIIAIIIALTIWKVKANPFWENDTQTLCENSGGTWLDQDVLDYAQINICTVAKNLDSTYGPSSIGPVTVPVAEPDNTIGICFCATGYCYDPRVDQCVKSSTATLSD